MTRAPGPRGRFVSGVWPAFQRDPIGLLQSSVQTHGDIVRLRFGPIIAHLLNDPDAIAHVLSRHADRYDKRTRSVGQIAKSCGASLLSAGPEAAQHRTLIQPLLQPNAVRRYTPVITQMTDQMLSIWRTQGGPVDVVHEMMTLVCRIVARLLFGADVQAARIEAALAVILDDTWRRIQAPLNLSNLSPRFHRRAFRQALAEVDRIVLDIIASRRDDRTAQDDVLQLLMQSGGDAGLSDQALRDAVVTLLLAGHETTANALAWAMWHCGLDPEAAKAPPEQIFAETIRLYPSIWIIERRAVVADTIGDFDIPKGSYVLISPYLLHRNDAVFPAPDVFDPSRFDSDAAQGRHRHAYLPFGLGQHRCIGLHLAQWIGQAVIAALHDNVSLMPVDPTAAQPDPGMTLRHKGPLWMQPDWR
ncbi:cytochrome P450 [Yoonia sp. 208BN28-4]|uniref:cytochrome P450 n=1 Tax=Yoonia sp. 208BN28-4 TaxID=3126505 RepID=UPI00309805E1